MANKIIGIYKIENTINGKVYVGQSTNMQRRWVEHRHELKKGIHDNDYLQKSYDKYGTESFLFKIIEECNKDVLCSREQYWIDKYKVSKESVYNLQLSIMDVNGENNPFFGKKHTVEARERMSKAKKGKPNWARGRIYSKESKIKMSLNSRSRKLNVEDVIEIKKLLKEKQLTHEKISSMFDVKRQAISKISAGIRWSWVE